VGQDLTSVREERERDVSYKGKCIHKTAARSCGAGGAEARPHKGHPGRKAATAARPEPLETAADPLSPLAESTRDSLGMTMDLWRAQRLNATYEVARRY